MEFANREAIDEVSGMIFKIAGAWNAHDQSWVPDVAKVILGVTGNREVQFVTGYPGSSINGVRPGRLVVFADGIVADVAIDHKDEQQNDTATPFVTVDVFSRRDLQRVRVIDDRAIAARHDQASNQWPHVEIELGFANREPIRLPVGDGEKVGVDHRRALLELIPSLMDDLAGVNARSLVINP